MQMWILGNPIRIEGAEFSSKRAIYICNHSSPLDIFLAMWLIPTGTVGIAKKEVGVKCLITYKDLHSSWVSPLQGHLFIDTYILHSQSLAKR